MFEKEKALLDEKVREFCAQKALPEVKLEWRHIPFSGEWGIAAPLFPLAAAKGVGDPPLPVPARAQVLAEQLGGIYWQPEGIKRVQALKGYLNLYFSTAEQAKKVIELVT